MATAENLQDAFAGESQANRKYLAFAKKADDDGMPGVARLFRAAGAAETVHAHAHLRAMGGIKDVASNLAEAVSGEAHEFKEMYPDFVKEAEAEGNNAAAMSFRFAMAVEEIHHGFYSEALETVQGGNDISVVSMSVCPICGNTFKGDGPAKCPICGTAKTKFFDVE